MTGAKGDGVGHGGTAERDDNAMLVQATVKQAQALTSFYGLRRT